MSQEEEEKYNCDLTNKKFGKLTVLYDTGKKSKKWYKIWRCKCDCGKELEVKSTRLINDLIHSCGCDKQDYYLISSTPNNFEDLSNQKFGMLTPLYYISKTNRWHCLCDCGKECDKDGYYMKNGRTISCGCTNLTAGEFKISQILAQNQIMFEREKIFLNCVNPNTNRHLRFDFYINNQYLIEFDGEQHYQSINYFGGENNLIKTQERDTFKNKWCKENNIPLIRIPYTHLEDLCVDDLRLETSNFVVSQ